MVQGHRLAQPTPLGALLTASHNHRFGVGLTWFSCCGFFVDSIAGQAGNATHFWAFKVGHTLSSLGAGSVQATPGMHALFYWTTFDPNTGATEPTLGLRATSTNLEPRSDGDVHRRSPMTMPGRARQRRMHGCR